jgi:DNA-binding transcriptional regulator YhcF (GntR family)
MTQPGSVANDRVQQKKATGTHMVDDIMEKLVEAFKSIGLDEKKATETIKNKKLSHALSVVIDAVKSSL